MAGLGLEESFASDDAKPSDRFAQDTSSPWEHLTQWSVSWYDPGNYRLPVRVGRPVAAVIDGMGPRKVVPEDLESRPESPPSWVSSRVPREALAGPCLAAFRALPYPSKCQSSPSGESQKSGKSGSLTPRKHIRCTGEAPCLMMASLWARVP
jgi:hypothetical protein